MSRSGFAVQLGPFASVAQPGRALERSNLLVKLKTELSCVQVTPLALPHVLKSKIHQSKIC